MHNMYQGKKNLENVGLGIDLGGTKIAGALFKSKGIELVCGIFVLL